MNGRRTRKQQIMTMSIIAVAIVTLSIGFAAFSSTLRISSTATVNPDSDSFSVAFSSSPTGLQTNSITPNPSTYGDPATIENGVVPTISGLNGKFTSPGQSVTYTFYALNEGAYLSYLNYVNFNNVEGESKNKKCVAGEGTTASLVEEACNGISISVKVGNNSAITSSQNLSGDHTLSAGSSETIVVTISYNTGSALADGPFDVIFGDIELGYGSALNGSSSGTNTPSSTPTESICTTTDVDSSGTINLSDTVTCGSESFYVISNNGTTLDMLAKYGLNVGQYQYANEATYGIQEEHVGEYNEDYQAYGAVPFADDTYWATSEDGSIFVNLSTYPTAFIYDENSNIYQYVEAYETYLKDTVKVTSASASVINEAQWSILSSKSWATSPMSWTGLHDVQTGTESSGGNTTTNGAHPPSQSTDVVVRPVVTISISDIQ